MEGFFERGGERITGGLRTSLNRRVTFKGSFLLCTCFKIISITEGKISLNSAR